ncbi:unnamed protein product [Dibothriocephalus latus]|uniref:Uncharacterized protein n=1 Tax=Dibothriocephalus latus TaxID=60516 RepID=A0A3P7QG04_DIBLA|nr:unnamed protein product [Dibothriocephalus latus]
MDIIKRPLFDQFLRPNPNLKSIVKHTALPCNRTTMDTLAFLMLHLLHAWEYASNPLTAKLRLAKIYGPLLVSFAERPVVLDQDPSDYKTEEGGILEVVLEECNGQFWDNLNSDSDYENEAWFSYLFPKPKTATREDAKTEDKAKSAAHQAQFHQKVHFKEARGDEPGLVHITSGSPI